MRKTIPLWTMYQYSKSHTPIESFGTDGIDLLDGFDVLKDIAELSDTEGLKKYFLTMYGEMTPVFQSPQILHDFIGVTCTALHDTYAYKSRLNFLRTLSNNEYMINGDYTDSTEHDKDSTFDEGNRSSEGTFQKGTVNTNSTFQKGMIQNDSSASSSTGHSVAAFNSTDKQQQLAHGDSTTSSAHGTESHGVDTTASTESHKIDSTHTSSTHETDKAHEDYRTTFKHKGRNLSIQELLNKGIETPEFNIIIDFCRDLSERVLIQIY